MASVPSDQRGYRLTAIDVLRGLVIIIMALDHVRDFFMVASEVDPMANPNITPALFLTRWITHFCAPVFVLLAGVSAGLMGARRSPAAMTRFLAARGIWLIVVEIGIVATAVTLSPRGIPELGGAVLVPMQVIWAIGASMVVLSLVQPLGRTACLAIGAAILVGHNLLDALWPASSLLETTWPLWVALHAQMAYQAGPFLFIFIYPLLAWVGVMLFGYGIAGVFEQPPDRRAAALLRSGLALTAVFLALRGLDRYGDPNHWQSQPGGLVATLIDFFNTTKYPPSLLFLAMTLGPAAVLCSRADRLPSSVRRVLVTFGRTPFAFYVAHVLLIHLLSILLGLAQGFRLEQMLTAFLFYPKTYGVGLPGVYLVWVLVVVLLYPLCAWVAAVKARRKDWWLSYL